MSKERLEAAKLMAKMLRLETRLPYDFPFDLVDWLVEQAERIQELEETVERYQSGRNIAVITKIKMDELEQQNKRYREALTFYAEKSNYDYDVKVDSISYVGDQSDMKFYRLDSEILNDRGEKARKALEGKE